MFIVLRNVYVLLFQTVSIDFGSNFVLISAMHSIGILVHFIQQTQKIETITKRVSAKILWRTLQRFWSIFQKKRHVFAGFQPRTIARFDTTKINFKSARPKTKFTQIIIVIINIKATNSVYFLTENEAEIKKITASALFRSFTVGYIPCKYHILQQSYSSVSNKRRPTLIYFCPGCQALRSYSIPYAY